MTFDHIENPFRTDDGMPVPALTADQMREVDRIAMEEFGLGVLQMMENAGRNLAGNVREMLDDPMQEVAVLAGSGGNGGGGLCCARHLRNHGCTVRVILDREPDEMNGSALNQYAILVESGLEAVEPSRAVKVIGGSALIVDALIGYSLRGAPGGRAAELIEMCDSSAARILSLDVPSGLNATTGEIPGVSIHPERTLTLALPKTGLVGIEGELYMADIGIPPELYDRVGISVVPYFNKRYWVRLVRL